MLFMGTFQLQQSAHSATHMGIRPSPANMDDRWQRPGFGGAVPNDRFWREADIGPTGVERPILTQNGHLSSAACGLSRPGKEVFVLLGLDRGWGQHIVRTQFKSVIGALRT